MWYNAGMNKTIALGVAAAAALGFFFNASAATPVGGFPAYDGKNFVPEVSGERTGFFHTHRTPDGKWWIIDPIGRGFGVFGVDHVRMDGHYTWQGETHPQLKGNLRKYGTRAAWEADTIKRLEDWGFNMLGDGGERGLRHRGLVHTDCLGLGSRFCDYARDAFIDVNEHRPCSGFPNVFHPDFKTFCEERAAKICAPQKDDPWLFGYFIDNELCWWGKGLMDDGLFDEAKAFPEGHSARRAVEDYLKRAGVTGEPSLEVKRGFATLCAEKYFSIASAAIRKADPNHMVLGARFAGTGGPHIWAVAGKYSDIVTFNCYATADLDRNEIVYQGRSLAAVCREYYGYAQKPIVVTEWSFPALDSGLPCTEGAGQRFRTQTGRTRATKLFAQTLLALPFVVGYDYFMWSDEPATGIACHFPENTNYGLTDNDGEAYPEITAMFTDLQKNVFRERAKDVPATREVPPALAIEADVMLRALGLSTASATCKPAVGVVDAPDALTVTNAAGLALVFGRRDGAKTPKILLDGEDCGAFHMVGGGMHGGLWHDRAYGTLVSHAFRNVGADGVLDAAFKAPDGSELTMRFTVRAKDLPFLVELVNMRNAAADASPVERFWGHVTSPFIDYSVPDSVQGLWHRPPYQCWFGVDGRRIGAVSLAKNLEQIRFTRNRDGDYSGAVTWKAPETLALKKGDAVALDGYYALLVPGRGGRGAWNKFVKPLKPSVDETGLDASPAAGDWPLITMRQMSSTSYDAETMRKLIAIHAKYPGSCGEYWLAEGYPFAEDKMDARAAALGDFAPALRAAGLRVGFQQGVTLGHDFSRVPDGGMIFPDDAYQRDMDGKKTAFLCPTSPDVLAYEERYAETYVRLGKLESFWLDDDLRLGFAKNRAEGCWCDRCLKLLNAKAGTNLTREQFLARINADVAEEPLRAVWGAFKAECVARYAAAARRGAKKANPHVRMGYQAISSDSISSGEDYKPLLAALSDDFKDVVGIRPGHGFYSDANSAWELPRKLLPVAREAERCRAYPGWKGTITYEQENYPHFAIQKSAESIVKECAAALAVGCDAVSQYWYSSDHPEPLDHYEDVARLSQAWRPYMKRLADLSVRTHLGGVAVRPDSKLMVSRQNVAAANWAMPRYVEATVKLALMGVPVTVAESGATSSFDPKIVPGGQFRSADRDNLLDALDKLPGGPVCVRVDKVHPLLVYPRVDDQGRTVAVTFVNVSTGLATRVPVRVRRPNSGKATLLKPCADEMPLALEAGDGDEVRFMLPDIPSWSMATIAF